MAKKSILDDAKKHVWHKSQVLYGMSDFWRIREKVKSMWDNTKAENNKERIPLQYRMVSRFKEELDKKVMFYAPFYEKDKFTGGGMRLDTYFNEVEPEIERYFDEGVDETSNWHVSIDIFGSKEGCIDAIRNLQKVFELEKQVSETGVISCISGVAVRNEHGFYTPEGVHEVYLSIGMEFEFQLCFSVASYYVPEFDELHGDLTTRELATYAEAFCLYIALRNEQNKLKEEAELYGIPFEQQEQQTEQRQRQQTEQEDNRWDTPRARNYFKKAIKAGLMEKTDDGHYRWKRSKKNPKAALGYFLQEVYVCKATDQIPYKSLEKLFGEKRLDSTIGSVDFNKKDQPWKEPIDDLFDD